MIPIDVYQVSKTYPTKTDYALDDVNLLVEKGEIVGIIGPNGAGKTTLGLIICGLLTPTEGSVKIFGEDVLKHKWKISKRYIASYFASNRLNDKLFRFSGRDYLKMMAYYDAIPGDIDVIVDGVLKDVGLWDRKDDWVIKYSTGMQKRIQLAELLCWRKPLMVLDEPTVHLDPISSMGYWDTLKSLRDKKGTTILLMSQNMEEVEYLCDRIIFINQGKIVTEATPEQIKKDVMNHDRIIISVNKNNEQFSGLCKQHLTPLEINYVKTNDRIYITALKDTIRPSDVVSLAEQYGYDLMQLSYEEPTLSEAFRLLGGKRGDSN